MDDFVTNKPAKPDEPLYLPPPEGGWAPETSTAPWDTLYEIRHFLEHPFFSISHKKRDSLERYESRDGKLHVEVKAGDDDLGVATSEDAEILMYVTTGLFPLLMKDPSCREVTFKRCDLLRRLHRNTGGNQYDALEEGLKKLKTTRITTNIGPDGRLAEKVTFSFLDSCEWNKTRRIITVRVSDWVAETVRMKAVVSIPEYYFRLPRGCERGLWRIARKHAGLQKQRTFQISLKRLREKMGASTRQDAFDFKIKEIVGRDPFLDYQMTWVEDPLRRRHKVLMTFRMVPKCMSSNPSDASEF